MAASDSSIYLVSGADLTGTLGPPLGRKFLTDAYCYTPGHGWRALANPPQPTGRRARSRDEGKLLAFGGQ